MMTRAQSIKEQVDKQDFAKIKNVCFSEATVNKRM